MGGRPELQQGKVDPSYLKHPILACTSTMEDQTRYQREKGGEMGKGMNSPHGHQAEEVHPGDGAACGGAVGVREESPEAPEPRQSGGAQNPSHG